MKVLHISSGDKFIVSFVQLVKDNFKFDEHHFLISEGIAAEKVTKASNVFVSNSSPSSKIKRLVLTVLNMHRAERVMLHGLFDKKLIYILFLCPWLLKKCYWFIWGGDLYTYQAESKSFSWKVNELIKKTVIKKLGHLVTYINGDVEIARQIYHAKGLHHECLMYTSNLYSELSLQRNNEETIHIQVGNSADPTNNHFEVFEKLKPFASQNIKVYAPLSYGNKENAVKVITEGRKVFGEKFTPITELLPFEDYLKFLSKIDIAFFNHNRQQAMGNIITLLGLGKKVYMRKNTSHWEFFKSIDIDVKSVDEFSGFNKEVLITNQKKVKQYFSVQNFLEQLDVLFNK